MRNERNTVLVNHLGTEQADDLCPCGVWWSKWPKENLSVHATDEDRPHVTIDIEKVREELRRLAEVKDEEGSA